MKVSNMTPQQVLAREAARVIVIGAAGATSPIWAFEAGSLNVMRYRMAREIFLSIKAPGAAGDSAAIFMAVIHMTSRGNFSS